MFGATEGVDGAYAKLHAAAMAHAQFFEDNPDDLELTVQERAEFRGRGPESHCEYHEKLIERMEEILQQGIESGELRAVDTRRTTLAMGCLLYRRVLDGFYEVGRDHTDDRILRRNLSTRAVQGAGRFSRQDVIVL